MKVVHVAFVLPDGYFNSIFSRKEKATLVLLIASDG
jgi:hypothetical protein